VVRRVEGQGILGEADAHLARRALRDCAACDKGCCKRTQKGFTARDAHSSNLPRGWRALRRELMLTQVFLSANLMK
jgi:hypothetical protein